MNKEVKCGLGEAVKPSLIDPFILMLNGIRHVEDRLKAMFRIRVAEEDDEDKESYYQEYTGTEQGGVEAIVQALTATLGSTHVELFAERINNPLRRGVPWSRVEKDYADMDTYIKQHLANPFYAEPAS